MITIKAEHHTINILHTDHGISLKQLSHIVGRCGRDDGFFITEVTLPNGYGTVPCGLYGPAMDDEPVGDDDVTLEKRGDRDWTDRILDRNKPLWCSQFSHENREVDYVQVIGNREGETTTVYTVYGGPLAPQNPDDPTCSDVEASTKFWSEHALA